MARPDQPLFFKVYTSILSNPDVDMMGLEAFGAYVLLGCHARQYGNDGEVYFRNFTHFASVIKAANYRSAKRILETLLLQKWIQISVQNSNQSACQTACKSAPKRHAKMHIKICKWRKHQEILNNTNRSSPVHREEEGKTVRRGGLEKTPGYGGNHGKQKTGDLIENKTENKENFRKLFEILEGVGKID